MARFHGEVGYATDTSETPPGSGVYVDVMVEHPYTGDVIRNTRKLEEADKVNEDITVANSISIVADEYAIEHFFKIKYLRWAGVLWTVPSVEVRRPRLILNIGSVYNGPVAEPVVPEV